EVADEKRLVDGHVLHAHDRLIALEVLGPVDQQERRAVRDAAHHLVDADRAGGERFGGNLPHVSPPRSFRAAALVSHATSRKNCNTGLAGMPDQAWPAGTLC